MPHVSSKKIKENVLKNIHRLLLQQFARVGTTSAAHVFAEEFLTPTEQVMLAKRFATIIMLEKGYSYGDIDRTLGVSSSTIARAWKKKENGQYDGILTQCFPKRGRGSRKGKELESILEVLFRGGLPTMGRGRWRYLYRQTDHLQKSDT